MTDMDVRAVAAPGLQAVPGLQSLLADAVVCDGDACFVPGAEGDWSEVPD